MKRSDLQKLAAVRIDWVNLGRDACIYRIA